jgi:hypothetical protein
VEVAIAAVAAQHEVLMNYFLIIVAIPYKIICLIATCLAIEWYLMLCGGFYSVLVLILNARICILTGVEPGTGPDGMYLIADILAVAFIVLSFSWRYIGGGYDDDDEDE